MAKRIAIVKKQTRRDGMEKNVSRRVSKDVGSRCCFDGRSGDGGHTACKEAGPDAWDSFAVKTQKGATPNPS